jgi:histidine ammonia-lyase
MLHNLRYILAIELLCACQGIDLLAPLKTGTLARKAYQAVRTISPKVEADRPLAPDINGIYTLIADGAISRVLSP